MLAGIRLRKPNIHCTCFFHDNKHSKSSYRQWHASTKWKPQVKRIKRMEITPKIKKSEKKDANNEFRIHDDCFLFIFHLVEILTLCFLLFISIILCVVYCMLSFIICLPNVIRFLHMEFIWPVFILQKRCCVVRIVITGMKFRFRIRFSVSSYADRIPNSTLMAIRINAYDYGCLYI